MSNEPEVIEQEMAARRAALSEKLETLETQVAATVETASTGAEKVQEVIEETVDTVESVRDWLDLPQHVRDNPWLMFGGAVAVGYVAGWMLLPARPRPAYQPEFLEQHPPRRAEHNGHGNGARRAEHTHRAKHRAEPKSTVSGALLERFGPEIAQLRGMAVGTVLSLVRDLVAGAAPEGLRSDLTSTMDGITNKLGGTPVHGPVISETSEQEASSEKASRRPETMAASSPPGKESASRFTDRGSASYKLSD